MLSLSCSKAEGEADVSSSGIAPAPAEHPTPLEVMEAKCAWPCDAPGCIKAPGGKVCQVRCEKDADCPAQSICICEADGCSLGKGNIVDEWPYTAENSCYPLDVVLAQVIEDCRREKNCSKHPGPP